MAGNPLRKAVTSALRMNDTIGSYFTRLGTLEVPGGIVTAAYRNANRAMITALQEPNRLAASREVMGQLRQTVRSGISSVYSDAQAAGLDEARRQLDFYKGAIYLNLNNATGMSSMGLLQQSNAALTASISKVDAQAAAIEAVITAGLDDAFIIGDGSTGGMLRASEVTRQAGFFGPALLWESFSLAVNASMDNWANRQLTFKKQAIATIDSHTTGCCLGVNGQIRPLNGMFSVSPPAPSDQMEWAPFHWYCRTSIALYMDQFDDGITDKLVTAAMAEMARR
jgi:hypothetical protein